MTRLFGVGDLAQAALLLRQGALVAFGTETVYGLGADATLTAAIAAVYEAKRRPRCNPLICHYAHADAAFADAAPNEAARLLARHFWPGPLTLVLPRRPSSGVCDLAAAGLPTLAVRVPGTALARDLCALAGVPVAAPSANLSGRVSPTTARHVLDGLMGRIAAVLDSGPCAIGVESTVIDLSGPTPSLLRAGGIAEPAIAALLGPLAAPPGVRAPGQLASHYAPRLPLRLDAVAIDTHEALLAFGPPLAGAGLVFELSAARDLAEAASRLFAGLRWLDDQAAARGCTAIAAMPIPMQGLGTALNDRLRRAAAR